MKMEMKQIHRTQKLLRTLKYIYFLHINLHFSTFSIFIIFL